MPGWARLGWWAEEGGHANVAVVGAGVVGRGCVIHLRRSPGLTPALIVNRTPEHAAVAFSDAGIDPADILHSDDPQTLSEAIAEGRPAVTSSAQVLADVVGVSVVIEATGTMLPAAHAIRAAFRGGMDVVSFNAELDALLGHLLEFEARQAGVVYTIADGDQPSAMLRMLDEVASYGLTPHGLLNCKRHLDVHQRHAQSRAYADRDGMSVELTTSAGDGTKMHLENVVVANLAGLAPRPLGTEGIPTTLATVADDVADLGWSDGWVHYTLGGDFGSGVVAIASSNFAPAQDRRLLRVVKLGEGPLHAFLRPFHVVYLEATATIAQVLLDRRPIGRRSPRPMAECVAIAKADLPSGGRLDGIGGDLTYGVAASLEEAADLVPIGLVKDATLRRPVPADRPITRGDVDLDDGELLQLRRQQEATFASAD